MSNAPLATLAPLGYFRLSTGNPCLPKMWVMLRVGGQHRLCIAAFPCYITCMQAVIDFLKQNESRFLKELCDYVRFPSVSAQPQHRDDMKACAEWVVKRCEQTGLEAQICPTAGHPIVLARTPKRGTGT